MGSAFSGNFGYVFGLTRALPGRYCLEQHLAAERLQTLMGWYLGIDLSLTFGTDNDGQVRFTHLMYALP